MLTADPLARRRRRSECCPAEAPGRTGTSAVHIPYGTGLGDENRPSWLEEGGERFKGWSRAQAITRGKMRFTQHKICSHSRTCSEKLKFMARSRRKLVEEVGAKSTTSCGSAACEKHEIRSVNEMRRYILSRSGTCLKNMEAD
eukprot:759904-Hanusia_phi.AAC.3